MNFVTHQNTAGVETKEIPCITGGGAPTTTTAGAVGCLYMDVLTGKIYRCTAATSGVYVWEYNIGDTGPQGKQGEAGPQGEKGETGDQGPAGAKGNDGYTPQKGVDYFTPADKEELVAAVLAALPNGDEVSY